MGLAIPLNFILAQMLLQNQINRLHLDEQQILTLILKIPTTTLYCWISIIPVHSSASDNSLL